jgi:hypothetical protein
MATRLYGLSRGETEFDIAEGVGSATSADGIELTVDLAVNLEKEEVLRALDMIKNHILKGDWPPA